jgi:hypothetical protein
VPLLDLVAHELMHGAGKLVGHLLWLEAPALLLDQFDPD